MHFRLAAVVCMWKNLAVPKMSNKKCELRFPSDLHQMRFYAMLPSCLFGIVMMQLRVEKRRHFALKAHSSSEHSSNSGGCFLTQIFWLDNFNRHIWNCCFIIFLHLTRLLALVINIEMWKMYECNYPNSPPYMLISLPLLDAKFVAAWAHK